MSGVVATAQAVQIESAGRLSRLADRVMAETSVTPTPSPTGSPPSVPTNQPTVGTPSTSGGFFDFSGPEMWFVALTVLIFAGLLVAATVYDLRYANKTKNTQLTIIQRMFPQPLNEAQGRQVLMFIGRPASGVAGLTRSLIVLSILVTIFLSLTAVLASTAQDAADLRKTLIASILSVFATIIGFYFGSRTAQTSADGALERSQASTSSATTQPSESTRVVARAGDAGKFEPSTGMPESLEALRTSNIVPEPTTAWPSGSYIITYNGDEAFWDGTTWRPNRAP